MDKKSKQKYVVGSGWWCSNPAGESGAIKGIPKWGHPYIRSVAFHNLWNHFVYRYTNPVKVVIVDSASSVKPKKDLRNEWISLDRNYQYTGQLFNGWLRGFMTGAWYAWNCNADFLYVEQDVIVVGKDWVSKIYEACDGEHIMLGGCAWGGAKRLRNWLIQQSLVFLPCGLIPKFLLRLSQYRKRMACEVMFVRARNKVPYQSLPMGYGRLRPIDFSDECFYAQHWSPEELIELGKREGVLDWIEGDLRKYK